MIAAIPGSTATESAEATTVGYVGAAAAVAAAVVDTTLGDAGMDTEELADTARPLLLSGFRIIAALWNQRLDMDTSDEDCSDRPLSPLVPKLALKLLLILLLLPLLPCCCVNLLLLLPLKNRDVEEVLRETSQASGEDSAEGGTER